MLLYDIDRIEKKMKGLEKTVYRDGVPPFDLPPRL